MSWKQPVQVFVPQTEGDLFAETLFQKLLIKARNEPGTVYLEDGTPIELQRGQVIFGRESWARMFGLNATESLRVQRKLSKLEKAYKLVNKQKARNCTIVTIKDYDSWVGLEQSDEQSMNNQRTNREQSMNTNKNDKNVKSDKSVKKNPELEKFDRFIEKFNQIVNAQHKGTKTDRASYKARIDDGYTAKQILEATVAAATDPFLMGENDRSKRYLTPEFILRPGKVDEWLNNYNDPKYGGRISKLMSRINGRTQSTSGSEG